MNGQISERGVASLGDCATLVKDTVTPSGLGDLPYIGLEHIGESTLSLMGNGIASDVISAKTRFRKGDILFEAVVIIACCEISDPDYRGDSAETPPLAKCRMKAQPAKKGVAPDIPDALRAKNVVERVDGLLRNSAYGARIGFLHSVKCLELLYSGLEDDSLDKT